MKPCILQTLKWWNLMLNWLSSSFFLFQTVNSQTGAWKNKARLRECQMRRFELKLSLMVCVVLWWLSASAKWKLLYLFKFYAVSKCKKKKNINSNSNVIVFFTTWVKRLKCYWRWMSSPQSFSEFEFTPSLFMMK
jgi:hypothetical protein